MTCFHPLAAMQPIGKDGIAQGAIRILGAANDSHAGSQARLSQRVDGRYMEIGCGQCVGCRIDRRENWAVRLACESRMHEHNWFGTLTLNAEHASATLDYRMVQAALSRLKYYSGGVRVRHAVRGEYAPETLRPHYHPLFFGLELDDLIPWSKSGQGHQLYRSKLFEERVWPYGYVLFGAVTYDSCRYVAGYCVDKITGEDLQVRDERTGCLPYERFDSLTGEVVEVEPEFFHCSKRPAIGVPFLEKWGRGVFDNDHVILQGREHLVPRAFDDWLRKQPDFRSDELQARRLSLREARCSRDGVKSMAELEQAERATLSELAKRERVKFESEIAERRRQVVLSAMASR